MALIDRVQARIETDLTADELQRLVDEALAAIEERWGPVSDPAAPLIVTLEGSRHKLDIVRPIDAAQAIAVVEFVGTAYGETQTTLAASDYRVTNGGRTLERLHTGTNPRSRWGHRVNVTYVPVNDGNQRQEVVVKLVQLAVEYEGVASRRVGDTQTSHTAGAQAGGLIYTQERERLIASLSPRKGLLIA